MSYPPKQFKLGGLIGVIGYAAKDAVAEKTKNGVSYCKFSLIIGKDDTKAQGQQGIMANCMVWRDLSDYASKIKKNDTVFVIGTVSTREYEGKTYTTLTADWLNIAKTIGEPIPQAAQEQPGSLSSSDDFEEIDTDASDLPF